MFTTYLSNKMIGPRAQSPTGLDVRDGGEERKMSECGVS